MDIREELKRAGREFYQKKKIEKKTRGWKEREEDEIKSLTALFNKVKK